MAATVSASPRPESPRRVAPLLDLDPDLGQSLDQATAEAAHRRLLVPVGRLAPGPWDAMSMNVTDPGHLGLLLLDGALVREIVIDGSVSAELLAPGEIIRPWELSDTPPFVPHEVRWNVLADVRMAILTRELAVRLSDFPEVTAQIVERLNQRSQRLAVTQAISQLNRVDDRLLALFWHLAERWGRMTSAGVAIPLVLPHELLAHLVGARRPTVSTALGTLDRDGRVRRTDDGTWLLTGNAVGRPDPRNAEFVAPRRRFQSKAEVQVVQPVALPRPVVPLDRSALFERVNALRHNTRDSAEALVASMEHSATLLAHSTALQAGRSRTRRA